MSKVSVTAFSDDALGNSDAVELASRIRSSEVSVAEVIDAAIARTELVNPQLNAVVIDRYAKARREAKVFPASGLSGALAGVPTFVKDNSYLAGLPTRNGSRACGDKPANKNGKFVEQFLSPGLVCLGKTTLPEFGIPPTTESLLSGATCNPWHVDYSTGGSSGGSAALVAAGVVPIAHANDGGGSIRIPAACCGLVGLKPTRNRLVNHDGTNSLPINVVHEGVVTRSVRDTALFMAEAEKHFRNPGLPALGSVTDPSGKRLRIALVTGAIEGVSVDPEVAKSLDETALLCESLGHHVEEIPFPFPRQMAEDFLDYYGFIFFMLTRVGKLLIGRDFERDKVERFSHDFGSRFSRRMLQFPAVLWRLKQANVVTRQIYKNFDVTLCPTVSSKAPKNGYMLDPSNGSEAITERTLQFAPFTPLQNITGEPAISLPMAMSSEGLPIGMHFATRFGEDEILLRLAYELEAAQPWPVLR